MSTTKRSLRVASLAAFTALATTSAFAGAIQGTLYEGFSDYTTGNIATATLNGGTGWNSTGDSLSANTAKWGEMTATDGTLREAPTTSAGAAHSFRLGGQTVTNNTAPERQQIVAGLTYSGLTSSTGAIQVSGGASGYSGTYGRNFGQTVDSGTFYFSYLVQKTVASNRTTNFQLFGQSGTLATDTNAATVERLSIGQFANNTTILNSSGVDDPALDGTANSGNFVTAFGNALNTGSVYKINGIINANTPLAFDVSTTYLMVGKVEFNVGANSIDDKFTLYINPTSLTDEGSLTPYMTVQGIDFGRLSGFRVFAGSTASPFNLVTATYDEIHFGDSFADVVVTAVPEPSSFAALAGLAGLALVTLRRRRA